MLMVEQSSAPAASTAPAPLAGIKVIEAASFIAGPFGGMILADLGAEVIKVEPPRGDPYRRMGKAYGDSGLLFKATNQNKQSVTIDLKSEDGSARFFELLQDADILLTNWRPTVAPSLGITEERIRADFPNLIWVRVSGYGQHGPDSGLPAYDGIIQARSGSAVSNSDAPANVNNNVADKVSAMFAAQTATAAVVQRVASGTGSICDVAMVDAMAYFYGADISAGHRMVGREVDYGPAQASGNDATFATADGWLALAPVSGRQVRRAMEAAGVGEAFADIMSGDRDNVFATFVEAMRPPLLERSALDWQQVFRDADVPATVVLSFDEHLEDPQIVHNGTYAPAPHAATDGWLHVRFPGLFNDAPATPKRAAAPTLDVSGSEAQA